jgi:hypothetical protein
MWQMCNFLEIVTRYNPTKLRLLHMLVMCLKWDQTIIFEILFKSIHEYIRDNSTISTLIERLCWLHYICKSTFTWPMAAAPYRWLDHIWTNVNISFSANKLCEIFFELSRSGGWEYVPCMIELADIHLQKRNHLIRVSTESIRGDIW